MTKSEFGNLHEIDLYEEYTRSYDIRYVAEIEHNGLGKFRTLKDINEYILRRKINQQFEIWDDQYSKQLLKLDKEQNKETAKKLSDEALKIQNELSLILEHTLEIDDAVDWETLKDYSTFESEVPPKPEPPINPEESEFKLVSNKPEERFYTPKLSFLDRLIPNIKAKKEKAAKSKYEDAYDKWKTEKADVEYYNKLIEKKFQERLDDHKKMVEQWKLDVQEIEREKSIYYATQEENNHAVEILKDEYFNQTPNSIIEYCEIVLNNSDYSLFSFPKDFELDYISDSKTLICEYLLPNKEDIPTLKEVKFISTRNELKEIHLSDSKLASLYDSIIYQIILRSLHELFEADVVNAIDAVVFNGIVNFLDKATGKKVESCIASIHVTKNEFEEIELGNVIPKICFKGLKGVASSKLSTMIPIKPILEIEKSDRRFVESKNIEDNLEDGYNLAAMDWEDFEHLVRELFHKEFSANGGEVKVTQSSRDGGVDAIAFDPDPIRGGKIVIQAKRYTNTVGVNAVRDLWGTTMNEGATKGILVTTSCFGSDAYTFAKNKPLTLLSGNNLLHLLEKHGYNAIIDIEKAKNIN